MRARSVVRWALLLPLALLSTLAAHALTFWAAHAILRHFTSALMLAQTVHGCTFVAFAYWWAPNRKSLVASCAFLAQVLVSLTALWLSPQHEMPLRDALFLAAAPIWGGALPLVRAIRSTPHIESELARLYTEMLTLNCGISNHAARKEVLRALTMCKARARKEGTGALGPGFGDFILLDAQNEGTTDAEHSFAVGVVTKARNEGGNDEDIREWWNLHDIQRRMVLWSEEVFRYAVFKSLLEQGLSADEAMQQVRRGFPMYGDPTDTTHTRGDDRPLPHELRGRVDRYREKWAAAVIEQRSAGYPSYNALVRAELRRGSL